MNRNIALVLAVVLTALASISSQAAVIPNALFSDGAVLQQGMRVPVWGTANDGERITVTLQNQSVKTIAKNGKWMVPLKPLKAGGPFTMTIAGENTVEIKNVLVGEVWICSGQSNMEWHLDLAENGEKAVADSADPMMRLFTVPKTTPATPVSDIDATWAECGPKTSGGFSAVGYYFGKYLRKALNVPVGLIHTSWGGTNIEAWTSKDALVIDKPMQDFFKTLPNEPQFYPNLVYNGMIAPLVPYAIRGAAWYQGETNAGQGYDYRFRLPGMINDWRRAWGQGDFPFLIVQIAPFLKNGPEPPGISWAEVRESQLVTSLTCPKTALVVTTDVGHVTDIHPKQKEPVGQRLALAAEAIAYGKRVIYRGPTYKSMKVRGDSIALYFGNIGRGLEARDGALRGFTIAGEDKKFCPAEAVIEGKTVVVKSADVPRPVAVRCGWHIYPDMNLFNKEMLPASPFRTDNWRLITQRN